MKPHVKVRNTLICALAIAGMALADGTPIKSEKLPDGVKNFLKTQFPQTNVIFAEKDGGLLERTTYEIQLDDGTKVETYKDGTWEQVENKTKGVPAGLIPKPMADYASSKFPEAIIIKLDKESYGYDMELNNGIELKFNPKGALLGTDKD